MFQRVRITYRNTVAATEIQSGQLGHVWTEAFAAAGIELAHPEGSRRVRIELAPPLPQAAIGARELLDAFLAQPVTVADVCARLATVLPSGLEPIAAEEIGERLPSLSGSVRAARYVATFAPTVIELPLLCARVDTLLAARTIEREELRGERLRAFDLRPLLLDLTVTSEVGLVSLNMRLALGAQRVGRPSSVLAALGLEGVAHTLVRTAVEVDHPRIAVRAWRAHGRFE